MKFLDELDTKSKRSLAQQRRHLPLDCIPNCYPISYHVGDLGNGHCVGLIDSANDLDCIRLCIFTKRPKQKVSRVSDFHMTPGETIDFANSLLSGGLASLEYNSDYRKLHEQLVTMRRNGDEGKHT